MNSITTILEFGGNHHCFLCITKTYSSSESRSQKLSRGRDEEIQVYEAENNQGAKVFFSIHSKLADIMPGDTVQLSGQYGVKLGLKDNEPLILKPIKSSVQTVRRVSMDPLSVDDWEILEQNAGRVELVLMDQVRVVWPGQIIPVWIQKSLVIFMKVTGLEPMSSCAVLEKNSEIVIAAKVRASLPPNSLSLPPKKSLPAGPSQAAQSPQLIGSPMKVPESPCKARVKDSLSAPDSLDTLEPKMTNRSPNRSPRLVSRKSSVKVHKNYLSNSDQFPDRGESGRQMVRRQSSLMESVMRRIFPFMDNRREDSDSHSHSDSDAGSAIDFSMQNLPSRNAVLRVQPMRLSCTLEDCMVSHAARARGSQPVMSSSLFSGRKWPSLESRLAEEYMCDVPAELFQTSTVYVDSEFLKTERQLHPHLPCLPPVVIARIEKLPSPQEKSEATRDQNMRKKSKEVIGKDGTAAGKSEGGGGEKGKDDSAGDDLGKFKGTCYVRVVGINRKANLVDDAWHDAADRILTEQALMWGHMIVPDILRRQLKLDATGSAWLQTGVVDIVVPYKICIYPVSAVPKKYTDEMLKSAFRAHIRLVADAEHPLVVFQGLLLKFMVFPGKYLRAVMMKLGHGVSVEAQITFFGENDVSSEKGVTMLSEMNIDSVRVLEVVRDSREDKLKVVNMLLSYSSVADFDPVPPTVKLKHLGGFGGLARQALNHLHTSIGARPLSRSCFMARAGLSHGLLLITGPKGCGKTSLAKALCRKMFHSPVMAHITFIDCKVLRGKTVSNIQKILESVFDEAAWREPSVVVFDNLDVIVPAPSGPESEMSGEALYSAKNAQVLQGLVKYEMENNSHVTVMATATARSSLHPSLVASRGDHMVQCVVDIGSPDKEAREKILTSILQNHSCISNETVSVLDMMPIAAKTEAYVARDLEGLVNRAVHTRLVHNRDACKQQITLSLEEFEEALCAYKPVSIRNIQLHKAGELGWEDVGGLAGVKSALVETLRWPTKYPQLFSSSPLRLRSGILLYGAPGTGKTLLAGVVAKECGLNFISIKGPELLSKYIGASEQSVRDLFIRAQSAKPCILFFDEFDSIAPKRGHDSTGVTDRVVNQFLTQLDGVEGLQGVYVLGATSRPDLIDPALLRPGRLDKCLFCSMPDESERVNILESLTRKMTLAPDVNLEEIANMCEHFTGADLKALLYNAQLKAIHQQADSCWGQDAGVVRIKGDDAKCDILRKASVILEDENFAADLSRAVEKAISPVDSMNNSVDESVSTPKKQVKLSPRERKQGVMLHETQTLVGERQGGFESMQVTEKMGDLRVDSGQSRKMPPRVAAADDGGEDGVDGLVERFQLEDFSAGGDNDDDDTINGGAASPSDDVDVVDGLPSPMEEQETAESSQARSSSWIPMGRKSESEMIVKTRQPEGNTNKMEYETSNSISHAVEEFTSKMTLLNSEAPALNIAIRVSESSNPDEENLPDFPDPANTFPPASAKRKRGYERAHSTPEAGSLTVVKDVRRNSKSPSLDKPVSVFPSLEQGLAALTPEDEARYLLMVKEIQRRDDRLFEVANDRRRTSLQLSSRPSRLMEVCQRHLVEAARAMRPSVSSSERDKYTRIYENFVSSRSGGAEKQVQVVGQRATLA
ncbi:peroxisome biogenesis factor 1 [Aplysia californica]|uniref:Peroxisomal ATPase PEX1 n=1 Tax=Aplysia californica TaxID=6500 RepID=A0ABM1A8V2_APLCA|nr:peroxisome biogenesis factor 1 [Aplysia californica]